MATAKDKSKKSLTIRLDRQTIEKAKTLAARRGISLSALLARQIELLVANDEDYERARRQAMTLLGQGFHLGGKVRVSRDELHKR